MQLPEGGLGFGAESTDLMPMKNLRLAVVLLLKAAHLLVALHLKVVPALYLVLFLGKRGNYVLQSSTWKVVY